MGMSAELGEIFWSHHSAGSSQRNRVSVDEKEEEAVLCLPLVFMSLSESFTADL